MVFKLFTHRTLTISSNKSMLIDQASTTTLWCVGRLEGLERLYNILTCAKTLLKLLCIKSPPLVFLTFIFKTWLRKNFRTIHMSLLNSRDEKRWLKTFWGQKSKKIFEGHFWDKRQRKFLRTKWRVRMFI